MRTVGDEVKDKNDDDELVDGVEEMEGRDIIGAINGIWDGNVLTKLEKVLEAQRRKVQHIGHVMRFLEQHGAVLHQFTDARQAVKAALADFNQEEGVVLDFDLSADNLETMIKLPKREQTRTSSRESYPRGDPRRGELLRRVGAYTSHISKWREQRDRGTLTSQHQPTSGRPAQPRDPQQEELARLRAENARLQAELDKAQFVIAIQKKVATLLGETAPTSSEHDR